MTLSALLYLILSVLGLGVVLPQADIDRVEKAVFVLPQDLPAGVCGVTITEHWPDGSHPNEDEIRITAGPDASPGCTGQFLPTAIIHEVGHVKCNEVYREWIQLGKDDAERRQRSEECAWYYVWENMPKQQATIFLPPEYVPVAPGVNE